MLFVVLVGFLLCALLAAALITLLVAHLLVDMLVDLLVACCSFALCFVSCRARCSFSRCAYARSSFLVLLVASSRLELVPLLVRQGCAPIWQRHNLSKMLRRRHRSYLNAVSALARSMDHHHKHQCIGIYSSSYHVRSATRTVRTGSPTNI